MAEKIDVSNIAPFCNIEDRVVDGIPMVFCPNTYVKTVFDKEGLSTYFISDKPLPGYHIHPVFVKNGVINPTGVLWSKNIYEVGNVTPNSLVAKAAAYGDGFEPYNIYDHHFIARLMLYECGDSDTQNKIGGSNTAVGVPYLGLNDIWGGDWNNNGKPKSKSCFIYGLATIDDIWHILSNKMDGSIVNTGIFTPLNSYSSNTKTMGAFPLTLNSAHSEDFDLSDVFLPNKYAVLGKDASIPDMQVCGRGYTTYHNYTYLAETSRGMFHLGNTGRQNSTSTYIGLRLRKAV